METASPVLPWGEGWPCDKILVSGIQKEEGFETSGATFIRRLLSLHALFPLSGKGSDYIQQLRTELLSSQARLLPGQFHER